MTEPNPGLIDRLRAANPVPHAVSRPDDAMLEEILMTTTAPADDPSTIPPSPRARLPLILGIAAALLLVAGVVGAFVGGDDPTSPRDDLAASDSVDPDGSDGVDGVAPGEPDPVAGGESQITSCVETYSPATLVTREYAFDGTVTSVDGANMTFDVNEWFGGGTEPTVTLDHQGYAGMLLDPATALEPGTRALVAGDGGFVWSCGFTQLWSEATAAEWRAAFAG